MTFGCGSIQALGNWVERRQGKNGLLIATPHFRDSPVAKKIIVCSQHRISGCFSDLGPDPTVEQVDACAQVLREGKFDFAVALGGGSALDCAKAACTACRGTVSVREALHGERELPKEHIPLLAIPTTAGTGSEVTKVAVLSDRESGQKIPLQSETFYPDAAIIDPELTLSVPPYITACTGMDVLSHALEGFWSKHHQPICDALAQRAAHLVFTHLLECYQNSDNLQAREAMCEASVLAGIAFATPKTSGPHACSYPLSAVYHLPHGEACALTLSWFARKNAPAEGGRLHQLAQSLGFEDAFAMADRIDWLQQRLHLKTTFSQAGVSPADYPIFAKQCMHPNMLNNPIPMGENDILKMCGDLN